MIPLDVIEIRQELCTQCADKAHDPCAVCVHGHWGKYVYCEPELPSLPAMAINMGKAIVGEAQARMTGVAAPSREEVERRLDICKACVEYYRESDHRCAHPACGCFLREKTALRAQHCPINKW